MMKGLSCKLFSLNIISNMVFLFFVIILFLPIDSFPILIDKTVAIFDSQIITLSQINRVQSNLTSRKEISPLLYKRIDFTKQEITQLMINELLISSKLAEVGQKIDAEFVELQINDTQKRLGINREILLKFLLEKNITFTEYFEIIKRSIENNLFKSRIIVPNITITDQQIKNEFFKKSPNKKTISFNYSLIRYSLPVHTYQEKKFSHSTFLDQVKEFKRTGIYSEDISELITNDLGQLSEEGLSHNIVEDLKKTEEGEFSEPVNENDFVIIFFIKKKELVESEEYQAQKELIRNELIELESQKLMEIVLKNEERKHYIKLY
jgi:peptidyl-prolyl cis-trans isomerase SurA